MPLATHAAVEMHDYLKTTDAYGTWRAAYDQEADALAQHPDHTDGFDLWDQDHLEGQLALLQAGKAEDTARGALKLEVAGGSVLDPVESLGVVAALDVVARVRPGIRRSIQHDAEAKPYNATWLQNARLDSLDRAAYLTDALRGVQKNLIRETVVPVLGMKIGYEGVDFAAKGSVDNPDAAFPLQAPEVQGDEVSYLLPQFLAVFRDYEPLFLPATRDGGVKEMFDVPGVSNRVDVERFREAVMPKRVLHIGQEAVQKALEALSEMKPARTSTKV